jgi:hypothetical protein
LVVIQELIRQSLKGFELLRVIYAAVVAWSSGNVSRAMIEEFELKL